MVFQPLNGIGTEYERETTYDAFGRRATVRWDQPRAGVVDQTESYLYDESGNWVAYYRISSDGSLDITLHTYDGNRRTATNYDFDGDGKTDRTCIWMYGSWNQETRSACDYDVDGEMDDWEAHTYDAWGFRKSTSTSNISGVRRELSYEWERERELLVLQRYGRVGERPSVNYRYRYDPDGLLIAVDVTGRVGTFRPYRVYEYDTLGRIVRQEYWQGHLEGVGITAYDDTGRPIRGESRGSEGNLRTVTSYVYRCPPRSPE